MADALCRLPYLLLMGCPAARALLCGSNAHPGLRGEALFYPYQDGTLLLIRALGLPGDGFYACHIHALGDCCTGGDVAFHCAGPHYDPEGREHPNHAGDLPVLLSSGGRALSLVYTGRFQPGQVLGRSVVLHALPDDYRSQPTGAAGGRIACGVISPDASSRARMACHAGPAFCSLLSIVSCFRYPTVTTRTTASPPSALPARSAPPMDLAAERVVQRPVSWL